MKPLDLEGKRYGSMTVLHRVENDKYGKARWLCRCDCGTEYIALCGNIVRGKTTRCKKCLGKLTAERCHKHGGSYTRLYKLLVGMKNRCRDANRNSYKYYGERGIDVCDEWNGKDGFENFRNWAINNGYQDGLTIERIDVNKGYSPDNCKWIPFEEQANNTRRSKYCTINGEMMTLKQASKKYGIHYQTIYARFKKGEEGEDLIRPSIYTEEGKEWKLKRK